jgi:RimJ/RimL family protein N-acetyltransferase
VFYPSDNFDALPGDRLARLRGLRLGTPRLILRPPSDEDVAALRELAIGDVHDPSVMPFLVPWTDDPELRDFVDYYRSRRESWQPNGWSLPFAVWASGTLVGVQDVEGKAFRETRTVSTGSWLGIRHQGRGYGTEMRAAVLEFAFHGLDAEVARSGYFDDNDASRRISEKLGYHIVGRGTHAPRSEPVEETEVELRREGWRCPIDVQIEGLEPALPLFGL